MTTPFAPIPSIKVLLQALFADLPVGATWSNRLHGCSVRFFSRGMWALAEGVNTIIDLRGKKNGRVWFPDYFCNEPLTPLRNNKISLSFYSIKKDLSPDWEKAEKKVKESGPPDIFVSVLYFGFPNDVIKAKEFCENCGAELLEDAAHSLLPVDSVGESMMIFSPRKLLPIPEGGVLLMPDRLHYNQNNENYAGESIVILKWLLRRLTQKVMLFLHIPWHRFYKFSEQKGSDINCNNKIENSKRYPNLFSLKMLSSIERNIDIIIERRRKNYLKMSQIIDGINGARPLFPSLPDKVCPYMFPIITDRKREIKKKLHYHGIPASSWPDLPPEILEREDEHQDAIWLRDHILLLPVHQELSGKQIDRMLFFIKKSFDRVN